jgi:uncharacterized protein YecT (DUF1311 family)
MTRRRLQVLAVVAVLAGATVTGLLLTGGGASAALKRDTYSSCLKHANSTFETDQCVATELKRLKPLVANAYSGLLNDPDTDARHRHIVVASQKAWTTYMKRDCAIAGDNFRGGTLSPVAESMCRVDRERTRIKDLKAFGNTGG